MKVCVICSLSPSPPPVVKLEVADDLVYTPCPNVTDLNSCWWSPENLEGAGAAEAPFSQFCNELEDNLPLSTIKLQKILETHQESVGVCQECANQIETAMSTKKELKAVETEVINLQLELVRKLKDQQQRAGEYFKKLEWMLDKVKGGDDKIKGLDYRVRGTVKGFREGITNSKLD